MCIPGCMCLSLGCLNSQVPVHMCDCHTHTSKGLCIHMTERPDIPGESLPHTPEGLCVHDYACDAAVSLHTQEQAQEGQPGDVSGQRW